MKRGTLLNVNSEYSNLLLSIDFVVRAFTSVASLCGIHHSPRYPTLVILYNLSFRANDGRDNAAVWVASFLTVLQFNRHVDTSLHRLWR